MKEPRSPLIAFAAFLGILLLIAVWSSISPGLCEAPMVTKAMKDGAATWCFEFWTNRYQTLISGLLTLFAAMIAAVLVWRQIKTAEEQAKIAAGLISPDFWITQATTSTAGHQQFHDLFLHCANQNRRIVNISVLELISPTGLHLAVIIPGGTLREAGEDGKVAIDITIEGTRPSASTVNAAKFKCTIVGPIPENNIVNGRSQVKFIVNYKIFAAVPRCVSQMVSEWADVAQAI